MGTPSAEERLPNSAVAADEGAAILAADTTVPGGTTVLGSIVTAWPEPALVAGRSGSLSAMNDGARRLLLPAAGTHAEVRATAAAVGADGARAAAPGLRLADLLPAPDAEALLAAGRDPVERIVHDDGGSGDRPVLRVRAASLGPAHVVVCIQDASGETRLRTHLGLAERLASIGEMLSSVAHELNNPLTTVLGYADLLLADATPETPRDELERIREEALRCKRIVGNLLDLARADAPDLRPCSVKQVVEKVIEFRGYAAQVAGIELRHEILGDPPVVLGDFHRLVQAVLNLVTNAEDAVRGRPEPRRITVRVRPGEGRVAVEVEDSGPGVPDAVAPFVFQPFFTTKPRGKGTGLGLSLVRTTFRQHGGDARVERAASGGALFIGEIPAADLR